MTSSEYTSSISGGLKLKGSKPSGVTKKKKKKAQPQPQEASKKSALHKALEEEDAAADKKGDDKEGQELSEAELRDLESRGEDGKTASERQFEEMRRKRLQDRLAREGVKTHKQRVEELNRYLSTLSEHHDMPRIGPG